MPPANTPRVPSPNHLPPIGPVGSRPLTPLSYLSSPVQDLASTLVTQVETDADDENVRFLRGPFEEIVDRPAGQQASQEAPNVQLDSRHQRLNRQLNQLQRTTQPTRDSPAESTDPGRNPETRDRMMRVLSRLSRMEEYDNHNRQVRRREQLDSAQSMSVESHNGPPTTRELNRFGGPRFERIMEELRTFNPSMHPEVMNIMAQSQLDRETDLENEARARTSTTSDSQAPSPAQERLLQERRTELQALERRLDMLDRRNDSLRSTAIMQHARTSNSTERMLRYIRDREQSGQSDHEGQGDGQTASTPRRSRVVGPDPATSSPRDSQTDLERYRNIDARLSAYRREYLSEHPSLDNRSTDRKTSNPSVSPFLEKAVQYLDRIRSCTSYDDALSAAMDYGFATKEFFADKHDDFPMDASKFCPPEVSSWLQPGSSFGGSQHTTYNSPTERASHRPPGASQSTNTHDASRPFDAMRPWLSHVYPIPRMQLDATASPPGPSFENWPVKVTIHSVDHDTMTLAGTMEAYDIPNQPSNLPPLLTSSQLNQSAASTDAKDRPITTYLEGHILDLRRHTFLTSPPSELSHNPHRASHAPRPQPAIIFPPTSATIDAANWRRLPPFSAIKDDDAVARVMLSSAHMQAINQSWIFMRWKERCFVHSRTDTCAQSPRTRGSAPGGGSRSSGGGGAGGEGDDTDTGHGLTISGFYYVSLRRSDGCVEGLYYDPSTAPYQCLRLKAGKGGVVGAWQFR